MAVELDQVYEILCNIHKDVGEIKAAGDATKAWLAQHVIDDKAMAADIKGIQLSAAKAKGAARTWGMVATGFGTVAGALAGIFTHHH